MNDVELQRLVYASQGVGAVERLAALAAGVRWPPEKPPRLQVSVPRVVTRGAPPPRATPSGPSSPSRSVAGEAGKTFPRASLASSAPIPRSPAAPLRRQLGLFGA